MPLNFSIQIVAAICTCHFVSSASHQYRTWHNENPQRYLVLSIKNGTKTVSVRAKGPGTYSCTVYIYTYFFMFLAETLLLLLLFVTCSLWLIAWYDIFPYNTYIQNISSPVLSTRIILYYCSVLPISLDISVTGYYGQRRLAWTILNESVYLTFYNNVAEVSTEYIVAEYNIK